MVSANHTSSICVFLYAFAGTSAFHITASDADDPSYGNSAKILYSILEGEPYFSVDAKTGKTVVFNLTATQGKFKMESSSKCLKKPY